MSTSTLTATATVIANSTVTGLPSNHNITNAIRTNTTTTGLSTSATLRASSSSSSSARPQATQATGAAWSMKAGPVGVKDVMWLVLGLVAVGFSGL